MLIYLLGIYLTQSNLVVPQLMLNYLIQWQRIELKNKCVRTYKYVHVFACAIRYIFLLLHAY